MNHGFLGIDSYEEFLSGSTRFPPTT